MQQQNNPFITSELDFSGLFYISENYRRLKKQANPFAYIPNFTETDNLIHNNFNDSPSMPLFSETCNQIENSEEHTRFKDNYLFNNLSNPITNTDLNKIFLDEISTKSSLRIKTKRDDDFFYKQNIPEKRKKFDNIISDFNNIIPRKIEKQEDLNNSKFVGIFTNKQSQIAPNQNVDFEEQKTASKTNQQEILEKKDDITSNESANNYQKIKENNNKREDNKIVKIKRLTFDDFENEINMKNKSYNIDLSIKIDNGIKTNIEGEKNLSLLKMKWKEILLENKLYQEKDIDIMYQIPEIRELLDMTFEGSLKNILKVKWEQIAEKEKNRQKKDYVQRKYKKFIEYLLENNDKTILEKLRNFIQFGGKNIWGRTNKLDNVHQLNIIERFKGYYYSINDEENFVKYVNSLEKYKNENFAINEIDEIEIDNYITSLKEIAENLESCFQRRKDEKKGKKKK